MIMLVKKNRGGRPRKKVKKTQQLAVMCTYTDRFIIRIKAKEANLTISEYLLKMGTSAQAPISKSRTLPKEILQFTGKINHTAGLLNQMTKKLNCGLSLNEIEMQLLLSCLEQLKKISVDIKNYLL